MSAESNMAPHTSKDLLRMAFNMPLPAIVNACSSFRPKCWFFIQFRKGLLEFIFNVIKSIFSASLNSVVSSRCSRISLHVMIFRSANNLRSMMDIFFTSAEVGGFAFGDATLFLTDTFLGITGLTFFVAAALFIASAIVSATGLDLPPFRKRRELNRVFLRASSLFFAANLLRE